MLRERLRDSNNMCISYVADLLIENNKVVPQLFGYNGLTLDGIREFKLGLAKF